MSGSQNCPITETSDQVVYPVSSHHGHLLDSQDTLDSIGSLFSVEEEGSASNTASTDRLDMSFQPFSQENGDNVFADKTGQQSIDGSSMNYQSQSQPRASHEAGNYKMTTADYSAGDSMLNQPTASISFLPEEILQYHAALPPDMPIEEFRVPANTSLIEQTTSARDNTTIPPPAPCHFLGMRPV